MEEDSKDFGKIKYIYYPINKKGVASSAIKVGSIDHNSAMVHLNLTAMINWITEQNLRDEYSYYVKLPLSNFTVDKHNESTSNFTYINTPFIIGIKNLLPITYFNSDKSEPSKTLQDSLAVEMFKEKKNKFYNMP